MGSKTKVYIVLEYVTGGELFDTIVSGMHIMHSGVHKISACHQKNPSTVIFPPFFLCVCV
jgi:hypothetical protein